MRLPADGYDVVTSIAAIHHMDFERALSEMSRILRPGGHLAILGLYRESAWRDYLVAVAAVPPNLLRTQVLARRDADAVPASARIRSATMSLPQIRRSASALLPGVRIARHLYWRYSLHWQKPGSP
jgi:SAM-dependent methyltransferase